MRMPQLDVEFEPIDCLVVHTISSPVPRLFGFSQPQKCWPAICVFGSRSDHIGMRICIIVLALPLCAN